MKTIYQVTALNRESDLNQPMIPTMSGVTHHHRTWTGTDKDKLIQEGLKQIQTWENTPYNRRSYKYKLIVGVASEEVVVPPPVPSYKLLPL